MSLAPDAAPWGLYKTTDGGASFKFMWDGNASLRGVNHVELDSDGFILTGAGLGSTAERRPPWDGMERGPYLLETNLPGVFAAGDVRSGSV